MRRALIVSAVLLLIVAVVIVEMVLQYRTRSNQRKTMATIRTFDAELNAYAARRNHYPGPPEVANSRYRDAWGNPLHYECWQNDPNAGGCDHYAIASPGSNGVYETGSFRGVSQTIFDSSEGDIVFRDGSFVCFPQPPRGMRN